MLLEGGLKPKFWFLKQAHAAWSGSLLYKSVWFCVLTVRIDFLRKCKQAGLLDDIFEEMLDTLHLAQEKLMDDNTSETGKETHGGPHFQSRNADLNATHLAPGSPSRRYFCGAK